MNPVTFNEEKHLYIDGSGTPVQSVTRIIREVFQTTTFGHSDRARHRGDDVHKCCQLISEGRWDEESTSPEIADYARGWEKYIKEMGYVSRYWEVPLVSMLGFAGKPDTWGTCGTDRPTWLLPDVKSGQRPATVGIQLAAYDMLIHENYPGTPALSRRAIQLHKTGKYTVHTGVNLPGHGFVDFNHSKWEHLWLSCLNIYRSGLMKIEEVEA